MTYEEAMNLVARGGVVTRGGKFVYMSVNFNSGMAGKFVTSDNLRDEIEFTPSDDDLSSNQWFEPSFSS